MLLQEQRMLRTEAHAWLSKTGLAQGDYKRKAHLLPKNVKMGELNEIDGKRQSIYEWDFSPEV